LVTYSSHTNHEGFFESYPEIHPQKEQIVMCP
jgi:hypothetical protein